MCLAIPGEIIKINDDQTAFVSSFGNKGKIELGFMQDIAVGDYVLIHAGFAIEKIDQQEAAETIKAWEEITSHVWEDKGDDIFRDED